MPPPPGMKRKKRRESISRKKKEEKESGPRAKGPGCGCPRALVELRERFAASVTYTSPRTIFKRAADLGGPMRGRPTI